MSFKDNQEYQLFVGFHDIATDNEFVNEKELEKIVIDFFSRENVDFSLLKSDGGYLYNNHDFILEHSFCINIIGASEKEMIRLGKSLSMFMNQESVLLIRSPIKSEFC